MLRLCINIPDGAVLHHFARVHNRHLVTGFRHNTQVVGYQKHGHLIFADQLSDDLQYLGLDGHIQRSGRLVRNQHFGITEQRHCDNRALLHSA